MGKFEFYKGKRVLVTGHTGFKGSWLTQILKMSEAIVTGYSLAPDTNPNLYNILHISKDIKSIIGDIRDFEKLKQVFDEVKPEIVFHLAAQPIVRTSYKDPRYTYETNVMGTVNLMECIRLSDSVKSVVNVTTDKVYENKEIEGYGYKESDPLNGFDPYSNSKSCSELVTQSYIKSFFEKTDVAISTARAGNVIGGGDFSVDRIIPDCVRAAEVSEKVILRNPNSTRPYQHVLEPLYIYLLIAEKQYKNKKVAGHYNVGPDDCDCITTGELTDLFCQYWGNNMEWMDISEANAPHEANFLKLDNSLIKEKFGWQARWHVNTAVEKTVEWSKVYKQNENAIKCIEKQIKEFLEI